MATAELAVALPALAVLLVVALSAVATALDQVRGVDAARSTARLLARGDDERGAVAAGRALAPTGATVAVHGRGGEVEVTVTAPASGVLGWLGVPLTPSSRAVAASEDAAREPP